eukprot:403361802
MEVVTLSQTQMLFQNLSHCMVMIRNLTPVMKYEQLKVENHFYEMLTATVSHDMRTPLNSMIGLLNNMDMFVSDLQGRRFLNIIRNSSNFMLFLVNDLLDFFQIKNGKFTKNLKYTDMAKSLRDLIEMFNVGASEKGIELFLEIQPQFPALIYVDEQRIKQVILNLLQNALKFTFQGHIKVEASFDYQIQELKISVTDTGVGISKVDQKDLFKMFGKLEKTQDINTAGVGLGLSICKQIVEVFDGRILIDSQGVGKGCKFTFFVKCQGQQILVNTDGFSSGRQLIYQETQLQENSRDANCLPLQSDEDYYYSIDDASLHLEFTDILKSQQMKTYQILSDKQVMCNCRETPQILVVDDNIFNIVTIETIIESQLGYKTEKAMNGIEAVEKFRNKILNFDQSDCICGEMYRGYKIIFMDCNMPLMDGFQATKEIRKLEHNYSHFGHNTICKIVALTAYSTQSFETQCLQSGMDDFLTKPMTAIQLKEIINKYM